METSTPRFYNFGEFILDSRRRVLRKSDREIPISAKNFDLLFELVKNEGRILSHDELLDRVWAGTFVEQSNLKKGISALRQILGETPDSSLYIKTIPRRGYSFVAPVTVEYLENSNQNSHITATEIIVEEEIIEEDTQFQTPSLNSNLLQSEITKKTSPYTIAVILGISLLLIAGLFWWYFTTQNKDNLYSQLNLENIRLQKLNTDGEVIDLGISPDGKFFVYAKQEGNSNQSLWLRKIGTTNAIQLVQPDSKSYLNVNVSPNNDFIYFCIKENSKDVLYQVSFLGGTPRKILENVHSFISFSPDGKKFIFARNKGDVGRSLILFDTENVSEKEVYQVSGDIHQLIEPRWSPDGNKFAFISSEKLSDGRIWGINEISADGKNLRNIIKPQKGKIYSIDWLRDGSGLIMSRDLNDLRQSQIFRVSYPNGEVQRLTNDLLDYSTISISQDGKSILALQEERKTNLWRIQLNAPENSEQITKDLNLPGRFSIFPDGKFLVEMVENSLQSLWILNPEGTNPQPLFSQQSADRFADISPDGKNISFVSRRSGSDQIWVTDIFGNNPQKLSESDSFIAFPVFSPNGENLYFEKYNGTRWQLNKMPIKGGNTELISNDTTNYFDFSPNGEFLGYGYFDEQNQKWKVAVRKVSDNSIVKIFDVSNGSFIRFTPDNKAIIFNTSDVIREGGNLWIQPLDGSPAKQILDLKDEKVFWANFSAESNKLFYTRGKINSSAVLLNVENTKN